MKLIERPSGTLQRRGQRSRRRRGADQLGEQRIELRGRRVSRVAARVHPDAPPRGLPVGLERARTLGDDARLDRVLPRHRRGLREAERCERPPRREQELRLHQVDAGDLFGHRVLHLDARVGLDEEVLLALRDDQELDRTRVDVLARAGQGDRVGQDALPQRLRESRRRGRLEYLLVAQLYRTVPLAEVHDVARRIAQDLHFDMPGALDEALREDGAAAERRRRFATAAREGLRHAGARVDAAHAAATTAGRRLEHDGIPYRRREFLRLLGGSQRLGTPGHHGDAERAGERARQHLVAKECERRRSGADERQPRRRAPLRERGVLGEKPVAGVHAVAAGLQGRPDQPVGVQVRRDRVGVPGPDLTRCRRQARMQRERVPRCVDRHGIHAEAGRGPRHANRDLAAVGNQNPFERRHRHPPSDQDRGPETDGAGARCPVGASVCRCERLSVRVVVRPLRSWRRARLGWDGTSPSPVSREFGTGRDKPVPYWTHPLAGASITISTRPSRTPTNRSHRFTVTSCWCVSRKKASPTRSGAPAAPARVTPW